MRRRLACYLAALLIGFVGAHAFAEASELSGKALLGTLKQGGYVVYLRHSITDKSKADAQPVNLANCSTQRPLSAEGRALAQQIGRAFASNSVRIDHVVSSPYCRAKMTAELAFPSGHRSAAAWLAYSLAMPKSDAAAAAGQLKAALAKKPARGENTVIIGHTSNLEDAAGIWPKKEGGALVFLPGANGDFKLVGAIDPDDFKASGS